LERSIFLQLILIGSLVNLSILKILYFPLKNLLNCFPIDPSEPTISKFNNYKIYI